MGKSLEENMTYVISKLYNNLNHYHVHISSFAEHDYTAGCHYKALLIIRSDAPRSSASYNKWIIRLQLLWNLSVTTTSIMKFSVCDLFGNVF